jgi:hypothetical protein
MPEPAPLEQRRQMVANAVQAEIFRGGVVQSQADTQAVVLHGKQTNHILHLLLTLVTCGLWAIVWLILALTNKMSRVIITVDERGQLFRTQM